MKTIGLIGGLSWQSTALYYQQINQGIAERFGELYSAKICMVSVNFAEIEQLQHAGQWRQTGDILTDCAKRLEHAGADFILICSNTMHKVYDTVAAGVSIPVVHIAEATAQRLKDNGIKKVGLLGTAFTMEQGFYKDILTERFGLEVLIPGDGDRELVHNVIYQELCSGKIVEKSREAYVQVMKSLKQQGAQGIILGCTEITLLVRQSDFDLPFFDTTAIHAQSAVSLSI